MIIYTRKRFEAELNRRIWEHEREDHIERRLAQLEEQVYSLEKKIKKMDKTVDVPTCDRLE